jgi:AraC-like DNA-binding protein/mannose-6-phosphate isomerase-like protein (cupin superfamily)
LEKDQTNLILLNVGKATHDGDWNWTNIKSPYFRIYRVIDGLAETVINGKTHTLKPGYLYLIPPFTLHNDMNKGPFSLYYLHIYEEPIKQSSIFERWLFPVEIAAEPLDTFLIKRLISINPKKELPIYDPKSYDNSTTLFKTLAQTTHTSFPVYFETCGIIWQLVARFLAKSIPNEQSQDSRVQQALHYIREHLDQKITIKDLANISFLSEDHFIRLFKKEMNQTPINYINQKKIEKAQFLLVVNNLPVKDIANLLSFENVPYFNRLFKKIVGHSPIKYKMSL